MNRSLETLPRRIFLDSCTAQTLRDYGGFNYEGEPIPEDDRIRRMPDGVASLDALRNVFLVSERAMFEWIVSERSLQEARDKHDPGHMRWLWDIADHSTYCLSAEGPTPQSEELADRLTEPKFGYCQRALNRDPGFSPNRDPLVTGANGSGRPGGAGSGCAAGASAGQ